MLDVYIMIVACKLELSLRTCHVMDVVVFFAQTWFKQRGGPGGKFYAKLLSQDNAGRCSKLPGLRPRLAVGECERDDSNSYLLPDLSFALPLHSSSLQIIAHHEARQVSRLQFCGASHRAF